MVGVFVTMGLGDLEVIGTPVGVEVTTVTGVGFVVVGVADEDTTGGDGWPAEVVVGEGTVGVFDDGGSCDDEEGVVCVGVVVEVTVVGVVEIVGVMVEVTCDVGVEEEDGPVMGVDCDVGTDADVGVEATWVGVEATWVGVEATWVGVEATWVGVEATWVGVEAA